MLIKCPECELQVSDKAVSCPHCGYPLKPDIVEKVSRKPKKNKRRRLPNGFGQISEIKGHNLRKPFRAMVTVGKTPDGRPVCKTLKPEAYFETYNDAYEALMEYNRNPYDLSPSITMQELYDQWFHIYSTSVVSQASVHANEFVWKYCHELYKMRVCDVRVRHLKSCIENADAVVRGVRKEASGRTKEKMKSILNLMLDYAVEQELTAQNYARMFTISKGIMKDIQQSTKAHIAFTDVEMDIMWKYVDKLPNTDLVLIQCYTGWRPQELGLIKIANTDLENWGFIGGMKTDAGKDRYVPIHPRIRELVKKRYEEAVAMGSEYLLNADGPIRLKADRFMSYDKYKIRFYKVMKKLGLDEKHKPHDGRVQFVTMAKRDGVDEYAIKYIVGHHIDDITEAVYTRRDPAWLASEIEKIK